MMHFTVEAPSPTESCVKCCCENLSLKPGTIERVTVGYAPWALPIGRLHCDPSFALEQMETCLAPTQGNMPPQVSGDPKFTGTVNTLLTGDLKTVVSDLENDPLKFKVLPLYGPKHGNLVLAEDGTFEYTPHTSYKGTDNAFVSMSDGHNSPVVFEVMLGVGVLAPALVPTPSVSIDTKGVYIDERYFAVNFPIRISPAAKTCEVWRLTVLQGALDCECVCYTRTDCFDIRIVKC
jgi:Bacterial Ig domain